MHRSTYCILYKVAATAAMHEAMQSVMSRGLWDLMRGHDEFDILLSSSHAVHLPESLSRQLNPTLCQS